MCAGNLFRKLYDATVFNERLGVAMHFVLHRGSDMISFQTTFWFNIGGNYLVWFGKLPKNVDCYIMKPIAAKALTQAGNSSMHDIMSDGAV